MEIESVVRFIKRVWNPVIAELEVLPDNGNEHDSHAISVLKDGRIVGHVPLYLQEP